MNPPTSHKEYSDSISSQYVVTSSTFIFVDPQERDHIKARTFKQCVDVFTSDVYAKVSGSIEGEFRVVTFIYNEAQLLELDIRTTLEPTKVEFWILCYQIDNGLSTGGLIMIKSRPEVNIELHMHGKEVNLSVITNMLYDNRVVSFDAIVYKKNNVVYSPYRRINVYSSEVYAKNFQNGLKMRLVDLYRPCEINLNPREDYLNYLANWFSTAMQFTGDSYSNGQMYHVRDPRLLDSFR